MHDHNKPAPAEPQADTAGVCGLCGHPIADSGVSCSRGCPADRETFAAQSVAVWLAARPQADTLRGADTDQGVWPECTREDCTREDCSGECEPQADTEAAAVWERLSSEERDGLTMSLRCRLSKGDALRSLLGLRLVEFDTDVNCGYATMLGRRVLAHGQRAKGGAA